MLRYVKCHVKLLDITLSCQNVSLHCKTLRYVYHQMLRYVERRYNMLQDVMLYVVRHYDTF